MSMNRKERYIRMEEGKGAVRYLKRCPLIGTFVECHQTIFRQQKIRKITLWGACFLAFLDRFCFAGEAAAGICFQYI